MKEYFKHFRFLFIAFVIIIALGIFSNIIKLAESGSSERTNTECTTEERVFDYADVLTDEEEDKLRAQIAEREKQIQADIVLVTVNESLKEYARSYFPDAPYSEFTMIYADNFYEEHKFGYNKPIGDGVLLLDNIYREDDGRVYTWMCTTGKAEDRYSTGMIDRILDVFYENVDTNPYLAYKTFVDNVYYDMSDSVPMTEEIPPYLSYLCAAIATLIYIIINLSSRKGMKTVNTRTYVNGGQPNYKRREDTFLRKNVTSRTIETSSGSSGGHSSSGGGGGHHTSSGGHSHGGGGHSR
ncbi:MAG: TPM domain-containing protein [Lachnospiraceae bacterium]|nr:TPM domain-containing protein [Lachnospiraceae bacterium]